MTFIWPFMLPAVLFIPFLVWRYLAHHRRRQRLAENYGGLQMAGQKNPGLRRHIPSLLFLIALAIMLVGLARPQAQVNLPRLEGTVMLVFDVSASMGAEDVSPTRMEAAKATAREIVSSRPETVRIGIVTFSGSGFTVQPPTDDTNALLAAVNRLDPQSGTSLGQGILTALNAIALDAGLEPAAAPTEAAPAQNSEQAENPRPRFDEELLQQLPEGPYPPSVIVLFSDGENTQSLDPFAAAQAAAEHEVRVDTIGFGTTSGADLEVDGFIVHTALDEAALEQISAAAGGTYYNAQTEENPREVYAGIYPQLVVKPEWMEVTALFTGAGILFLFLGSLLSLLWFNRLV